MHTDWFVFLGDFSHDLATNMLYLMPVLIVLMAIGAWRALRQADEVVRELQRAKVQAARDRAAEDTERRP
ncbi:hypothetical protein WL99_28725 [Burkholderia cepacia]|uniref:hypothetical protein n=1 Tax=Burkholderia cepacia TaxID=292 RepID=UPI00075B3D64|nr:hypothetical protein [Burkholderia cepacia]KVW05372.1 hypothetical protein WK91_01980 [Burkholderia cepacia]KWH21808.1 hypothetical protein WL99_28725 [Burkholderia cepacia]RQT46081.1 hypothetical protein DF043_37845 [Burkholderia cepacia]